MITNNEILKPDNATLVVRRVLDAPAELAFDTWTSAEHIRQWMKPEPGMEIASAKMDLRPGGRFRIQMKMPDGEYFTAAGEFQEVVRPSRLVYTWDWEVDGSGEDFGELEGKTTLLTVEFIARGKQTEFILTHTRFATLQSRDSHAGGWDRISLSFAAFLTAAAAEN